MRRLWCDVDLTGFRRPLVPSATKLVPGTSTGYAYTAVDPDQTDCHGYIQYRIDYTLRTYGAL